MRYLDLTGLQTLWTKIKALKKVSAGNGITVASECDANGAQSVAIKLNNTANGLVADANGLAISLADGTNNGAMPATSYAKLAGITEGANKVEASTVNGNIKINGTETTVYTHAAHTAYTDAVKVTTDAEGHVIATADMYLNDLADVSGTATENQFLRYNGTNWAPESLPTAAEYTLAGGTSYATTDYAAVYWLEKDSVQTGSYINIPKDQFLNEAKFFANAAAAATAGKTAPEGTVFPTLYFEWELTSGVTTPTWVPVNGLVDVYTEGNGIDITNNAVSVVVDPANANGLSVGANGVALATATDSDAGAMSAADHTQMTADHTKLNGIVANADKVSAGTNNGDITVTTTSGSSQLTVYTHPTATAADVAAVKVGKDTLGHVVLGGALTSADIAHQPTTGDATTVQAAIRALADATGNYLTNENIGTTASHGVALSYSGNDFQVSVTPGTIEENNTSVVTGGAAYTAIENAKTAILGGASADYNTLKKLEDKIKENNKWNNAITESNEFSVVKYDANGLVTAGDVATPISDTEINALS